MKSYDQTIQHTKKQRHYFANKGPFSQSYIFSSSHIWMWELEYKESWALYNWCFWTVVLEKTLENSWTAGRSNESIRKEISPEYSLEDWCWSSNTLATWCEELTRWKRPWCWARLNAGDARDAGLIPGSGRYLGEVNGNPLHYSCLGHLMDRGSWRVRVHRMAKESDMT